MDLGAYANIENLSELASKNGISVPRLRGYRLMANEEPINDSEIKDTEKDIKIDVCEDLIERRWSSMYWYRMDETARRNKKRYMTYHMECDNNTSKKRIVFDDIRWDRIHGKHRKMLKLEIKQKTKAMKKQYDLWNSYCGRSDVLYIHARIGGNNWLYYEGDATVANKPWFLGRADDYYDCTYCDIYAKIEEL